MKIVGITYGTFDLFHIGHLNMLRRARESCDMLVVGVSSDRFNEEKGKCCLIPYDQRVAIVKAVRYVDQVIVEDSWDQKILDIKKFAVKKFFMGSDWLGKFDNLSSYCDVTYLDRTEGVSSTQLRMSLGKLTSLGRDEVVTLFDLLSGLRGDLT